MTAIETSDKIVLTDADLEFIRQSRSARERGQFRGNPRVLAFRRRRIRWFGGGHPGRVGLLEFFFQTIIQDRQLRFSLRFCFLQQVALDLSSLL